MRTILYPDGNIPKPRYFNNNDNFYTLLIFSLIILTAFFTFIFYLYGNSKVRGNLISSCPLGYCATSLDNGSKRCPLSLNEKVYIDPQFEVCNPQYFCTDVTTPYALLADNSVDLYGVCEPGTICSCTNKRTCPNYSTVVFDTLTPIYTQTNVGTIGTGGQPFNLSADQKCVLNASEITSINCLNMTPLTCVQSNPCVSGIMSYIPPPGVLPEDFIHLPNYQNNKITCIPGKPCKDTEVSVYNFYTNAAVCVEFPLT